MLKIGHAAGENPRGSFVVMPQDLLLPISAPKTSAPA
jgi:hypothetical protein